MLQKTKYRKLLIANRGEIAVRVIRACRELNISPIAVYSEADASALHVQLADEAYLLGPAPAHESYLRADKILAIAKASGAEAVHPGYGFLSENDTFAADCAAAGIDFIGPPIAAIQLMGSKIASKQCMDAAGVPTVPGYYGDDQSLPTLRTHAERIGFPLLVKASAGGGGKGMRVVASLDELEASVQAAKREAMNAFGDDAIFLERYFTSVRHIEFQILADTHGQTLHLYERECSIQRRHQKIVEETPSVALNPELRAAMAQAAIQAALAVGYVNAGTVEMLLDDQQRFYFLEMNTRLQVEHPITEMLLGVDLVKEQIRIAAGEPISFTQAELQPRGHALEVRLYAEDPDRNFMPTTGKVHLLREPQAYGVRVDSALYPGMEVTPYYDPMLAKLVTVGHTRTEAIARMQEALRQYQILGVTTNQAYLQRLLAHPQFAAGAIDTHFVQHYADDLLPAEVALPVPVLAALAWIEQQQTAPITGTSSSDGDIYNPWLRTGAWQP
jgi:3-methylcrotonyl-CoA carboxylase alpha subunit